MACRKGLFDKTLFDQAIYGAAVIIAVFALFNPSQFQNPPFDAEQICPVSTPRIGYQPGVNPNFNAVIYTRLIGGSAHASSSAHANSAVFQHAAGTATASSAATASLMLDMSTIVAANNRAVLQWLAATA